MLITPAQQRAIDALNSEGKPTMVTEDQAMLLRMLPNAVVVEKREERDPQREMMQRHIGMPIAYAQVRWYAALTAAGMLLRSRPLAKRGAR